MRNLFLAVLLLIPIAASAQQPGTIYVAVGIVAPYQSGPSGETYQTYSAASGGWTIDFMAGAGVVVTPRFALEGEWSRTGVMESTQPSRYGMTFHDRRRDQFLSFVGRFPLTDGAIRIEPVGGIVFTFPEASTQTDRLPSLGPQIPEHDPTIVHELDMGVGFTVGCDVRIGGDHFAVVPSFRFSQTGVSGGRYSADSFERDISAIYPGGYPGWTYRGGVGVRIGF